MASSAMITVPTTASRFALLQIDSDSDSDASDAVKTTAKGGRDSSGKPRHGKAGAAGAKAGQCNDKKKDKKKKKKEQQQTEANEVSEWQEHLSDLCYTCLRAWRLRDVAAVNFHCASLLFHFAWTESVDGPAGNTPGNTDRRSFSVLVWGFGLS